MVGNLTLDFEIFSVNNAPGRRLVVYRAEPGSGADQLLALLGSFTPTDFPDLAAGQGHIRHRHHQARLSQDRLGQPAGGDSQCRLPSRTPTCPRTLLWTCTPSLPN
ncbi:hypothetical protein OHB00_02770 [Streptomyces sp. NBC_00631]|uniref:hypothetical protein n=1 Tax=Streptomyces sp. NBC_00631 TaxID=2975793 RepID=UPI0030E45A25